MPWIYGSCIFEVTEIIYQSFFLYSVMAIAL